MPAQHCWHNAVGNLTQLMTALQIFLQLKLDVPEVMLREKGLTPPPKHALNLKGAKVRFAQVTYFLQCLDTAPPLHAQVQALA